jgi:hypothetical protein
MSLTAITGVLFQQRWCMGKGMLPDAWGQLGAPLGGSRRASAASSARCPSTKYLALLSQTRGRAPGPRPPAS